MSRYFLRLARRTGILDAGHTRGQTAPTRPQGGIGEIHQQVLAPSAVQVQTTEHSSRDIMRNAPTQTSNEQTGTVSSAHFVSQEKNGQASEKKVTSATPFQAGSMKSSQQLPRETHYQDRSISQSESQTVLSSQKNFEKYQDGRGMEIAGGSHDIIGDEGDTEEIRATRMKQNSQVTAPRSDSPLAESKTEVTRPAPGHGDDKETFTVMTSQSLPSPPFAADQHTAQPLSSVNSDQGGLAGRAVSVTAKSYKPQPAMPEKRVGSEKHENIEISIGSISMEVYQKQPAVTTIAPQPKSTGGSTASSNEQSQGFRPSRYYLRGI